MTRLTLRVLFLALLTILSSGCGGDEKPPTTAKLPTPSPSPEPEPFLEDSLVFGNPPGIVMGESTLTCCGLYDTGFVNEPVIRIRFWDPAFQKNGWSITLLTDAAAPGTVYTLPLPVVPPHKVPTVVLFVAGGEYSSDTDGSSGTITIHSFACGATTTSIDFSVDAILHSEYWDGGQIEAKGRFRAVFPKSDCPQ